MADDKGKKEEKKVDIVKTLRTYESAYAADNFASNRERAHYAINAMLKQYEKMGIKVQEDYILSNAFRMAQAGIQEGHITNDGVFGAMKSYAARYAKAWSEATVKEVLEYFGAEMPAKTVAFMQKYESKKVAELVKSKDKNEHKAAQVIGMLREQKLEADLYGKAVKEHTRFSLEAIVQDDAKEAA